MNLLPENIGLGVIVLPFYHTLFWTLVIIRLGGFLILPSPW
jgi:hypothetical protein